MYIFKFALKNLYAERKKSYVYGIAVALAVSFIFVFFNLYCIFKSSKYQSLVQSIEGELNPFDFGYATELLKNSAFLIFVLIMIFVSVMCIYYANSYYLIQKKKDIGILLISGGNMLTLMEFLTSQNLVILGIAIPFGILAGTIFIPMFNMIIILVASMDIPYFFFSFEAVGYTIAVSFLFILFLVVANAGYIYRSEMVELLKDEEDVKRFKKVRIPDFLPFAGYVLMVICGFIYSDVENAGILFSVLALICMSVYLTNHSSSLFLFIQYRLLNERHRHLYLGNVRYDLANNGKLFTVIFMTILLVYQLVYITSGETIVNVLALCCFSVAILMLGGCAVFKQCMTAVARKEMYHRLLYLGYSRDELETVIRNETTLFYLIMIIIAEICFFSICYNIAYFVYDFRPFEALLLSYPIIFLIYMELTKKLCIRITFSKKKEGE